MFGEARSFIGGFYGPLDDRNMLSFAYMFKLSGLMSSLKRSRLNLLSMWNISILKPLVLYMLMIFFNSLMVLSALFEIHFFAVTKVILDVFVWSKVITFIFLNIYVVWFSCDAEIYMLEVELLVTSRLVFCGISCLLVEVL